MNEILDADWIPVDELDQIRRRRELDAAFDHAVRRERAYDYLRQVDARRWRRCGLILLGSVAIFAWSLVLALLVGAV